nr:MAG TPA: hypothetical protein [Caudoviricetes sp.]
MLFTSFLTRNDIIFYSQNQYQNSHFANFLSQK